MPKADIVLIVGVPKPLTAQAFSDMAGTKTAFPADATYAWTANDPNVTFKDATKPTTEVTASRPQTNVSLVLNVKGEGYAFTATHTADAVTTPPVDIHHIDFTADKDTSAKLGPPPKK